MPKMNRKVETLKQQQSRIKKEIRCNTLTSKTCRCNIRDTETDFNRMPKLTPETKT